MPDKGKKRLRNDFALQQRISDFSPNGVFKVN